MRLRWAYRDHEGKTRVEDYWKNLMGAIHQHTKTPNGVWGMAFEWLEDYGAVIDGDYIHFEHDQDATLFLLRWS
jgi:hypothetical protein